MYIGPVKSKVGGSRTNRPESMCFVLVQRGFKSTCGGGFPTTIETSNPLYPKAEHDFGQIHTRYWKVLLESLSPILCIPSGDLVLCQTLSGPCKMRGQLLLHLHQCIFDLPARKAQACRSHRELEILINGGFNYNKHVQMFGNTCVWHLDGEMFFGKLTFRHNRSIGTNRVKWSRTETCRVRPRVTCESGQQSLLPRWT